jgi:formate-dependent nitrite reductase membrane component NrfD
MMTNRTEGQRNWGWPVVVYVFLAGCGGGTFLLSYLLRLIEWYEPVARAGLLIGPILAALGSLLLVFDLGVPARCYRLFMNPAALVSSWMSRGSWILGAFIVLGLAYGLPSLGLFGWLPWSPTSGVGRAIGLAAAVLSVVVPLYPGFLLGVVRSVPLWNTPALPPLFFLSGLDAGVAVLAMVSLALPGAGPEALRVLAASDMVLILLLFIALLAYLEIVRQSGSTAAESIRLLADPLFVVGVIVCGMLVPLVLLGLSTFASDKTMMVVLDGSAAVLVLAGGLLLRYGVVRSGVRLATR